MEHVSCNLCGSNQARPVVIATDETYGTPGSFTVVRCDACGLSYLNPRPTPAEIGDCYPPHYGEHSAGSEPNAFARAEARHVGAYFPRPGAVLDVGCAAGYFLRAMRESGWEVAGVEPDESAARSAATVAGARVRNGTLGPDDFAPASFDAVTLWSVLEHLHDPVQTLTIARRMLKPSGRIFIGIPNFGSLERRLFGAHWFGLDVPRHLYHFTPRTIRRALERAGFEAIEVGHSSGHDTFKYSASRKARRAYAEGRRGDAGGSQSRSAAPPRPADNAIARLRRSLNGAIVGSFTTLADRLGAGSQLLVTARPRC